MGFYSGPLIDLQWVSLRMPGLLLVFHQTIWIECYQGATLGIVLHCNTIVF